MMAREGRRLNTQDEREPDGSPWDAVGGPVEHEIDEPGDGNPDDEPNPEHPGSGEDSSEASGESPADEPAEPMWRGQFATLRAAMDTYAAGWRTFLPLSASVAAVAGFSTFLTQLSIGSPNQGLTTGLAYALIFLNLLVAAAIVDATDAIRSGQPRSSGQAFQAATRRVRSILGGWILVWLSVTAVLVVAAIPLIGAIVQYRLSDLSRYLWPAAFVAIGGLVIVYLAFRWSFLAQAILLEGVGAKASLGRSWSFTRGRVLRLGLLGFLVALLGIPGTLGDVLLSVSSWNPWVVAGASFVATTVLSPIVTITTTIAFRDLTGRADAPGLALPRRWPGVLAGLLVVDILLAGGGIAAFGSSGFTLLPNTSRGEIVTGTRQDPAAPCSPGNPATSFTTSDEIWLAAVFSRHVPPGAVLRVEFSMDGVDLGGVPLESGAGGIDCYYETKALIGLGPGTYGVKVTLGDEVISEGTFTVR